jgi:hypothetical protein
MSVKTLSQKIEKSFWTTVIPIMSESPFARRVVQKSYSVVEKIQIADFVTTALALAALGLATGFVLGFIGGLI